MKKILLVVDMEGMIGVLRMSDMEHNIRLAYREISVVVSALLQAGYDNITVCNIHDDGSCLDPRRIENMGAAFIQGIQNLPSVVGGFTHAFMLGFHGKRDSGGRFDHTFRADIQSVFYGAQNMGEVGAFYRWMTSEGICVMFISGEGNFKDEVRGFPCVVHDIHAVPFTSDDVEREYQNFQGALCKAIKRMDDREIAVCDKLFPEQICVKISNPDAYDIMRESPLYDSEKQEFVFSSLQEFFLRIYDFAMELNRTLEIIGRNNLRFMEKLKQSKYRNEELAILLCDYLEKRIFDINQEDRMIMAGRAGIVYENTYTS